MRGTSPAFAFLVASFGIGVFSAMDAVMKGLTLALGVYLALFWRTLAGIGFSGLVWWIAGARRPSRAAMRLHLIRGAVSTAMALLFFWGLARVPMAQAIALTYVAPLIALFLAALLLGERVRGRTVAASLVAAAGVGVILAGQAHGDLGDDAFRGALAILASALCYSWNIILMRQQALVAGPVEITLFQGIVVALLLAFAIPWLGAVPAAEHWPAILLGAALATVSLGILSWAYARAEASYLAPTEFTSFLWAAFYGWILFGEHVSMFTLAGAALIICGCVWGARGRYAPQEAEVMP
ncbi:DMT family transporter [Stakelama tenebrarum]|uniref:DMT family transporter n=1 Tax=Stakelama tenebrarum TaxID=2711215 RepID=A0A6G6Y8X5_9SPHN|nr:DMT family transporter [Sphingosinithalassobacter tenebrarum]QIG81369.1 DMT family transporter [Sphingosinithalassobacter tenebrarum]